MQHVDVFEKFPYKLRLGFLLWNVIGHACGHGQGAGI
jgi:hypothetical protein